MKSRVTALCLKTVVAAALVAFGTSAAMAQDPSRASTTRLFPTGSVIFFHPDGIGPSHWQAARTYFAGPDGLLNWDLLPSIALYRGHMSNVLTGTSNGGATTHAFGWKVDGLGSFGKDGDGNLNPPTDKFINNLAGFQGSIMRQAASAGMPVGVVNDGHVGEPGTGAFLAEVGNRNNWQEITRQMIQGRPGFADARPWVIMGGGEADTLPMGATLLHRNHNQDRGQPLLSNTSLRTDALNLEADWDTQTVGGIASPASILGNAGTPVGTILSATDNAIVIKTREQFEALRTAMANHPGYAPRVLGLFAYQDLFNDRNEEDLIARGKVNAAVPVNHVGPLLGSGLGFRAKASRLVLWGDADPVQPGFNPPTYKEKMAVAIALLDRAAKEQANPANRRFLLVAEQEANDNFGNNNNAVGTLHAIRDTDDAIGVARAYLAANPRTLIVTAADSDASGMTIVSPSGDARTTCVNPATGGVSSALTFTNNFSFGTNAASGLSSINNIGDGLEGRGLASLGGTRLFVSEPDANGSCHQFGIAWTGGPDFGGAIVSRAAGLNAGLLSSVFGAHFDNIDVYRMMHLTLFGNLLNYPTTTFATPGAGLR